MVYDPVFGVCMVDVAYLAHAIITGALIGPAVLMAFVALRVNVVGR